MSEKRKMLILFVILFVLVGLAIGYFFLAVRFNDGHGGLYLEVRQCSNVRAYTYFLEEYLKNEKDYPDELPKLDRETLTPTINGREYRIGANPTRVPSLNNYLYKKTPTGYELTFSVPNGKQFTVHSPQEANTVCSNYKELKCTDYDLLCNWHYSAKN